MMTQEGVARRVYRLRGMGSRVSHFVPGGLSPSLYEERVRSGAMEDSFLYHRKQNSVKYAIIVFLLIGSYSRQLSSGVLLNLHTMINLHTSLACIPWQHLATACFQKVVSWMV